MKQQEFHFRSAMLAGKELRIAWREAQRELHRRNEGDSVISIGDGHLLLEMQRSNTILKHQIENLQLAVEVGHKQVRTYKTEKTELIAKIKELEQSLEQAKKNSRD